VAGGIHQRNADGRPVKPRVELPLVLLRRLFGALAVGDLGCNSALTLLRAAARS